MKNPFIQPYKHIPTILLAAAPLWAAAQKPQAWTLQQCIEHALTHNLTVRRQEVTVENNRLALSTARNSRLPNLNAGANQNFSFGRGLTYDNTYANTNTSSTSFSLSTDIPIWDGGQIENNVTASRLNLQAALADLDKAKEDISLQVTSAYLEALYQKELLGVAERQASLSREQLQRVERLYQNGKKSEAELAEAQATVASDELSLTQQRNSRDLALLELTQLLELSSPQDFDVSDTFPDTSQAATPTLTERGEPNKLPETFPTPDAVFAEAVQTRPLIQAEQLRLKSAERQVNIARSGLFPSLNFSAGLGSNYYKTSGFKADNFSRQMENNFSQYLGLSLSIPIFNRFAVRNQIRQAKLQVESQQIVLEDTRKALYKEIQQAYHNAVAAQKQHEASRTAAQASTAAFRLMQKKYENGKATATEFDEAKTRSAKAESDLLQSKYTLIFRSKILNFYCGAPLY